MFGRELDFRVQPETQWGYPLHLSNVPCALSLPLSLALSLPLPLSLTAASDGGKWDAVCFVSPDHFHGVRRGRGIRRLWCGCGGAEQISPELSVIFENIVPSASPSCSPTAPFYGHLKTHKSTMIHQTHVSSTFWFI